MYVLALAAYRPDCEIAIANEIWTNYVSSSDLYACVFKTDGTVYRTSTAAFEAWGTAGRTAIDYDIVLTETAAGASSHYTGTFPVVVAGVYRVTIFEGNPAADADDAIAQGTMYWDGTAPINISTLDTTIEDDVIGGGGDTLESLSDQIAAVNIDQHILLNIYDETDA